MSKLITIELHKENMKFSAAHFTIFSASQREAYHGHNYNLHVALTTLIAENGLNFDYRYYKDKIYELCQSMNQTFLLPGNSTYLRIEDHDDHHDVFFAEEKMVFLKRDVTIMPICNITVEELSTWFVEQLIEDHEALGQHNIRKIQVKVFSAPGQSGMATWETQ